MCDRDRLFELISDELDGTLDEDGAAELASHLESDPEARELRDILSAAHGALDFEADPPPQLLQNVMDAVAREKRSGRARVIRITAGFAAAAAVLAVAMIPGALRKNSVASGDACDPSPLFDSAPVSEDVSGGSAEDSGSDQNQSAYCYIPDDPGAEGGGMLFMMPGATQDGLSFTAEDFCVNYYAVLYFSQLPQELVDPEPVLFSDGTAGHIITMEQFDEFKELADQVVFPDPEGVLIMAVAPAEE